VCPGKSFHHNLAGEHELARVVQHDVRLVGVPNSDPCLNLSAVKGEASYILTGKDSGKAKVPSGLTVVSIAAFVAVAINVIRAFVALFSPLMRPLTLTGAMPAESKVRVSSALSVMATLMGFVTMSSDP
jgi:hypothetical protein